jgi:hypothetical protein
MKTKTFKIKHKNGGSIRSPNMDDFNQDDVEIFLQIVKNTRIINKEKHKNDERQSDEFINATYLVDSDIDDLISNNTNLTRRKIQSLVKEYIKIEDAKNIRKNKINKTASKKSKKKSNKKYNTV